MKYEIHEARCWTHEEYRGRTQWHTHAGSRVAYVVENPFVPLLLP